MFDSKKCPGYMNGRWYTFFVESDGSEYTLTTSDLEDVEINSTVLTMPEGFHIVDFKVDLNNTATSAVTYTAGIKQFADGRIGVVMPAKANIDYCNIYIFGYFAE